ncbi:hypothetical protein E1262_11200 [Jiangella aurantiaca]|uniref:Glycosyl hydrolases family 39 N-terminal catalytic domain-containing protein n=1 Tax=Jiangella aurantiaca TaxID=2530373 RepID=A0A4V2YSD5_9ACTN|nr:hypothetical protein [Jiangella aurantiaca]TDD69837.1 hypothetical protein E1262_11200 [Jiangella aurantiaca]
MRVRADSSATRVELRLEDEDGTPALVQELGGLTPDDGPAWFDVRLVAQPAAGTCDVYVDGTRRAAALPVRAARPLAAVAARADGIASITHLRVTVERPPASGFELTGGVRPRSAAELAPSPWSVGGETIDRDFTRYEEYKRYLGPLGVTGLRLQAGWGRTEQTPGHYDWAWLDTIIDDALAQGVQPWVETSYGNPIYPGAGHEQVNGPLPSSAEGLAAWDGWVAALVTRYRDRVDEWEIWNEPDVQLIDPIEYAEFYIRTAEVIRSVQPAAKIYGPANGLTNLHALDFVAHLADRGKLDLLTAITYHHYAFVPEVKYLTVEAFARALPGITGGRQIPLFQGESGAPSTPGYGALANAKDSGVEWSETTQAKWNLRRALGDFARGIRSCHFSLCDMAYSTGVNYKGLLHINAADRSVVYAKESYYALQALVSVFDAGVQPLPGFAHVSSHHGDPAVAAYGFQRLDAGHLVAAWTVAAPVNPPHPWLVTDIRFAGVRFTDPVYVDLRTGAVYELPAGCWRDDRGGVRLRGLPLYDSPIVIAERGALPL